MKAYIFDGKSHYLTLKSVYEVEAGGKLERSSTQTRYSLVNLLGMGVEDVIEELDIIKLEISPSLSVWGFVIEPSYDSDKKDALEITIGMGTDGLNSDAYIDVSTSKVDVVGYLIGQVVDTTNVPYYLAGSGEGYIISPDKTLPLEQCFRQLYRQGFKEKITVEGEDRKRLKIEIVKEPKEYTINLEGVLRYEMEFSNDNFNAVIAYQKETSGEEEAIWKADEVYLNESGGVTTDKAAAIRPIKARVEIINVGEYSFDKIANLLKNQEYKNHIKIEIDANNYLYREIICQSLWMSIGSKINIYLKNGKLVSSLLDEISYEEGVISMVLGGGSARMWDRVKERVKR